jgi:nucleotide-binding universal stress UspA family protein
MPKILVPCDGSDNALRAVRYAASLAKQLPDVHVELLNVQDPVLLREHAMRSVQEIEHQQADEAGRILQPARTILDEQGLPYQVRCRTGSPANEIARHVHENHCDAIIMGTRGLGPVASLMIGSVATRTIHLVDVPVTLIK